MLLLLPMLLGCQDPFAVDRHDLVGFRVAAVEVEPVDPDDQSSPWVPRVAMVVDGRPFADEQPLMDWFWLQDPDDLATLDPLSEPHVVGPAPELTLDPDRPVLGLLARWKGQEQRSFVVLDDDAREEGAAGPRPDAVRARAIGLTADTLDPETSALEARRALPVGADASAVPSGGALRLDAVGVPARGRVRWMATAGTFLELDGATTDWFASDLYLDDGEVEERADLPDQAVTFVALSTGTHRARFAATDRIVTDEALASHTWVNGRFMLGVELTAPAWVTLQANDEVPTGLSFVDPEPVEPPPADLEALAELDAGTADLPCFVPVEGPFDPNWLLEMRCPRRGLDGARVLLVPDRWRDGVDR